MEVRVEGSDSQKLWKKVAESAQNLISSKPFILTGVGIGSAGPIDLTKGTISPVNIPLWREFPIVQSIQEIVELDNVLLYGDAMTVALAEHRLGAGRGLKNLLGMVVSTGIGGGLII
ncbi:MAG: ROK family protein, partial [Actinobacteria bacterium]|nr:ROK family protein [Actinomycetota bacterium]